MFKFIKNLINKLIGRKAKCIHNEVYHDLYVKPKYIGFGGNIKNSSCSLRYNVYDVYHCTNCNHVVSKSKVSTNIPSSRLYTKYGIKV